ncbi:MAG: ArsO family NAD(P)H-dependent flavin-containing monooxygenase [Gemmatimonadaceae bacterium]
MTANPPHEQTIDAVVVGGGQAALAVGFYLRRSGLSFVILDEQPAPGGTWRRGWRSLRAFSPAQWSSLPGWQLSKTADAYPSRDAVVAYLAAYETRYQLPVHRDARVTTVMPDGDRLRVEVKTSPQSTSWLARAVVSTTGNSPSMPDLSNAREYTGRRLHSAAYTQPSDFTGRRVVVVGGGNSGAQIVADLTTPGSGVAHVTWATLAAPTFLPDDVDGRYLFEQATLRYKAEQAGLPAPPMRSLGDIVMVPPVRAARDRGDLTAHAMFSRFTEHGVFWPDGTESVEDAIILATGFKPALGHLARLGVVSADGRVEVGGPAGTRAVQQPTLWLVGYGNWTGYASATLIGVGRSARATVDDVVTALATA